MSRAATWKWLSEHQTRLSVHNSALLLESSYAAAGWQPRNSEAAKTLEADLREWIAEESKDKHTRFTKKLVAKVLSLVEPNPNGTTMVDLTAEHVPDIQAVVDALPAYLNSPRYAPPLQKLFTCCQDMLYALSDAQAPVATPSFPTYTLPDRTASSSRGINAVSGRGSSASSQKWRKN